MSLFTFGLFANLPDSAPDAPVDALDIRAAEGDKKDNKPEDKAPADPSAAPELGALPNIAPPSLTPTPAVNSVGSAVRDKLSGQTGVVVAPPPGDFGAVIFVKSDSDGMTHPMLADYLELAPMAAAAPVMNALPSVEPAPGSPIPGAGEGPSSMAPAALNMRGTYFVRFVPAGKKLDAEAGTIETGYVNQAAAQKRCAALKAAGNEFEFGDLSKVSLDSVKRDGDTITPIKASATLPSYRKHLRAKLSKKKVEANKVKAADTHESRGEVTDVFTAEKDGKWYVTYKRNGVQTQEESPVNTEAGAMEAANKMLKATKSDKEVMGAIKAAKLELWKSASNYMGEDYSDYYVGLGRSRDSEVLERANFDAMLEMLGGESEDVVVARSGHWAVGWVEVILVQKDSPKVAELQKLMDQYEEYPVLDDDRLAEYEFEQMTSDWESYGVDMAMDAVHEIGGFEDKEFTDLDGDIQNALRVAFDEIWGYYGGDINPEKFASKVKESLKEFIGPTADMKKQESEGQQELPGIERMKAGLKARVLKYAAKLKAFAPKADLVLTASGDDRKLTYAAFLSQVKAIKEPSHASALAVIGYVPSNWDVIVARLMQDGVVLKSKMAKYDVMDFVAKGLSEPEIRLILGGAGVPMYSLDQAFQHIKADAPPVSKQRAGELEHIRHKARGEVFSEDPKKEARAQRLLDKTGSRLAPTWRDRHNKVQEATHPNLADYRIEDAGRVEAAKPTKPMPPEPAGDNMVWAWDNTTQEWYQTSVTP